MGLSIKAGLANALIQAAGSAMTAPLTCARPWLRLAAFIPIAVLSTLAAMVALVVITLLVPPIGDRMDALGDLLEETPFRLVEESLQTLVFGVMFGLVALSFLAAAALTWRVPLKDFLWPGRSFDPKLFGIGLLVMTAISAIWIPFSLATGSEWRPPVFDPYYVWHTRILYVVAMAVGLLVAAAAEEVAFRGVLLRVSGLITRRAVVLCLINGLLFSAFHLDPDPVSFIQRTLAGMGWAWAALRLGGLEFAIGSHFANNLFIALIWSPVSTASQVVEVPWFVAIPELVSTAIVVIVVEVLARRRAKFPPVPENANHNLSRLTEDPPSKETAKRNTGQPPAA